MVVQAAQEIEHLANLAVLEAAVFIVRLADREIHHQLHHLKEILVEQVPPVMVTVLVVAVEVVLQVQEVLEVTLAAADQQLVVMVETDALYQFLVLP